MVGWGVVGLPGFESPQWKGVGGVSVGVVGLEMVPGLGMEVGICVVSY